VPERLANVTVQASHGLVSLPWDSRQALLEEPSPRRRAAPDRRRFEAVGAMRPVEIPQGRVRTLVDALDAWAARVDDDLAEGVVALRDAVGGR
jgi:CelD/BcsL family acetyltransferase involved in cellulose biosynthesis